MSLKTPAAVFKLIYFQYLYTLHVHLSSCFSLIHTILSQFHKLFMRIHQSHLCLVSASWLSKIPMNIEIRTLNSHFYLFIFVMRCIERESNVVSLSQISGKLYIFCISVWKFKRHEHWQKENNKRCLWVMKGKGEIKQFWRLLPSLLGIKICGNGFDFIYFFILWIQFIILKFFFLVQNITNNCFNCTFLFIFQGSSFFIKNQALLLQSRLKPLYISFVHKLVKVWVCL